MKTSNNPFSAPFEVFGNESSRFLSDGINDSAYDAFIGRLEEPVDASGCVVLLRSPRAGYGKTALLQRARVTLLRTHLFLPFNLLSGHQFDSGQLLEDILTELSQQLPEGGGLTAIDYVSRRILARGLDPMIASGEIHSQNKEEALEAIRETPEKTFDFHDDEAATAQWIRDNFETVGSRLATELSIASKATLREVAYWVELFYRYASTLPTSVARNGQLFETVFGGQERRGSAYNERVMGLIRLLNLVTRPVLVLDDTEGLSGLPAASLEVVSGLVSLSQACKGTAVVLCMNSDIWESGVAPRLPGGLKDRVMDKIVDLKPLSKEQARDLIRFHAGDSAGPWVDDIDLGDGVLYSRGVLKLAAEVWRDRIKTPEPMETPEVVEEKPEVLPATEILAPQADVVSAPSQEVMPKQVDEALITAPSATSLPEESQPASEESISAESVSIFGAAVHAGEAFSQAEQAESIVSEESAEIVQEIQAEESVFEAPSQLVQEAPVSEVASLEEAVTPVADQTAPVIDTPFQLPDHSVSQESIAEEVVEFKEEVAEPFSSSPFVAEVTTSKTEEPEFFEEPVKELTPEPVFAQPVSEAVPAPLNEESALATPTEPVNPFESYGGFSPFNVAGQDQAEEQPAIPQPRPPANDTFVPPVAPPASPFTAAPPSFNAPATPQQGTLVDSGQGVVPEASPFQVAPQGQQPAYQPPSMPEAPRQDPRAFNIQATVSQEGVQSPQQQVSSPFQIPQPSEPAPQAPVVPPTPEQAAPAPFANPFKNPFAAADVPAQPAAPASAQAQESLREQSQPKPQAFVNPFTPATEQPAPSKQPVNESAPPVQQPVQQPFTNPFEPASQTPPSSPPPAESSQVKPESNEEKRVEDLLEQFKNRYGRD